MGPEAEDEPRLAASSSDACDGSPDGAIIAKAANLVLGVAGGTAEPPMSGQCGDQTTQDGVSCCLVPVG